MPRRRLAAALAAVTDEAAGTPVDDVTFTLEVEGLEDVAAAGLVGVTLGAVRLRRCPTPGAAR